MNKKGEDSSTTVIASFLVLLLVLGGLFLFPIPASADPDVLYVAPAASGLGDCSSWSNACELQTALTEVITGQEIWVAKGQYYPTTTTDRTISFELQNGVAIYGGFSNEDETWEERDWETNLTILSGNIGDPGSSDNSYHVVAGNDVDATAALDGFTISDGNANGSYPNDCGGGMYNSKSSPTLTNVIFSWNTASFGGGMYNETANPNLTNVFFFVNTASYGGGMYNYNNSSPVLSNVTFTGNQASSDGGGLYNYTSNPTLTNIKFSNNLATSSGGGMKNIESSNPTLTNVTFTGNSTTNDNGSGGGMDNFFSSSPTLTDVTFTENTAERGGGMSNHESSPTLTNVTFSENSANGDYGRGGGMYNLSYSSPTLTNVTFSGNTSSSDGGGLYNCFNSSPNLNNVTVSGNTAGSGGGMHNYYSSRPKVINSIFWGNSYDGIYSSDSDSWTEIAFSDIQDGPSGNGNIDADPLLGTLADNGGFTKTHALGADSPAIDSGNPENCPATDQRGYLRPIYGDGDGSAVCDMGAYEYSTITIPTAPTGVAASDGTYMDKVRVSWNPSNGAAYYQVFRNTSNNSADATTLVGNHPSSPYDDITATP